MRVSRFPSVCLWINIKNKHVQILFFFFKFFKLEIFVLSFKKPGNKLTSLACEANASASEPQKYFRIPVRTWTNMVQKFAKRVYKNRTFVQMKFYSTWLIICQFMFYFNRPMVVLSTQSLTFEMVIYDEHFIKGM